jgi:hypothetical protein
MEAHIYGRPHYGSGQLPYMHVVYAHLWKSASVYACFRTSIYVLSINARFHKYTLLYMHVYAHLQKASFVYAHIFTDMRIYRIFHICTYMHIFCICAFMEDGLFHICAFTNDSFYICTFTEVGFHICALS